MIVQQQRQGMPYLIQLNSSDVRHIEHGKSHQGEQIVSVVVPKEAIVKVIYEVSANDIVSAQECLGSGANLTQTAMSLPHLETGLPVLMPSARLATF